MKVATRAADSIDVTHLRHTAERDPGWKLIHERVEAHMHQTLKDLAGADSWERVIRLQERHATLAMLLELPVRMIREAKSAGTHRDQRTA